MRLNDHDNTELDYKRANKLRNEASPFEKKLWVCLRELAKSHGLKFRRQHAIHPFIVDFACMEARLVIELDGASHDARSEYDKRRAAKLIEKRFTILRYSNEDVAKNANGVAETIIAHAVKLVLIVNRDTKRRSPLPNPPHEGEGILLLLSKASPFKEKTL